MTIDPAVPHSTKALGTDATSAQVDRSGPDYEPHGMLAEIGSLFAQMVRGKAGRRIRWLVFLLFVILICNMAGQVRLVL